MNSGGMFYECVSADCIMTHQFDDIEEIKRTVVIELGDIGTVEVQGMFRMKSEEP